MEGKSQGILKPSINFPIEYDPFHSTPPGLNTTSTFAKCYIKKK